MDFPVKVLPIGQQSNTSYHGREKIDHTFLQSWPILKCIDNVNIFHGKGSIDVEIYRPADWYIGRRKAIFLLGNLWEKRIRNMENWLNFYPMANLTKTKTNFGRGPKFNEMTCKWKAKAPDWFSLEALLTVTEKLWKLGQCILVVEQKGKDKGSQFGKRENTASVIECESDCQCNVAMVR